MPSDNILREKVKIIVKQDRDSLAILNRYLDNRDSGEVRTRHDELDMQLLAPRDADIASEESDDSDDGNDNDDRNNSEAGIPKESPLLKLK